MIYCLGTPEIGGLTSGQGLELVRGCRGLNIIGCDLVEVSHTMRLSIELANAVIDFICSLIKVSPPYDPLGTTAVVAANLLFEMLCALPKVK